MASRNAKRPISAKLRKNRGLWTVLIKSEKSSALFPIALWDSKEKLLFIGHYEAVREAGSKLLVYKPGLAQSVGTRPSVGETARSTFRLLCTIRKRIKTSLSLLHESHQIFRFSLLGVLEGKLAVSAQEVDSALMDTLPHIIPYLQIL